MTEDEQRLADDKMRAEISNLIAHSGKLHAETAKINKENDWYLVFVGAAFFAATAAFVKLFL